jgi:hypothetical protein
MQDITVYVPPLTVLVLQRAPDPKPVEAPAGEPVIKDGKKPRARKAAADAKPARRACAKALKAEDIPADRCGEVLPKKGR